MKSYTILLILMIISGLPFQTVFAEMQHIRTENGFVHIPILSVTTHPYVSPIDAEQIHITAREASHRALDMVAPIHTPIHAIADGTVVLSAYVSNYGNVVFINHANGVQSRYAHLIQLEVSKGELVHRSDIIGHIGVTGRTTGPHLHFEMLTGVTGNSAWGDHQSSKLNAFEIMDFLNIENYFYTGRWTQDMRHREALYRSSRRETLLEQIFTSE